MGKEKSGWVTWTEIHFKDLTSCSYREGDFLGGASGKEPASHARD